MSRQEQLTIYGPIGPEQEAELAGILERLWQYGWEPTENLVQNLLARIQEAADDSKRGD